MELSEQIELLERSIDHGLSEAQHLEACSALKSAYMLAGERSMAYSMARRLIADGTPYVSDLRDTKERNHVMDLLEGAYVTLAPDDLHSYLVALEWHREPDKRFYLPRMRVMKPIADAWTDMFVNDRYDLMLFSMPPGTGKSTLGIFGCTWVGWRQPERCNLMSGYADKIVNGFFTEINTIFDDPEYNTHKVFPRLEMVTKSAKNYTMDFTDTGRVGAKRFQTFTCRSIDGSLTGATRCENLLYCDDLVEGIEEALNPTRLDTLWQKYTNDLASRKKDTCKEVHIGTRWSVHDPIGRLEELYGYSDRTKIINLPALDGNDESLFDYDFGVGFSTKYFHNQRSKMDDVSWKCLYQQQPIEREGLVFPEDALTRFYGYDPEFMEKNPPDDIFAFCDVAFGGDDYLSMPIVAQWGDEPYVVDWVFMRGDYQVTQPIVVGKIARWKVRRVIFEANNGGDFYAQDVMDMLKRDHPNLKVMVGTKRASSKQSKLSRILQHSPVVMEMRFLDSSVFPADGMYRAAFAQLTSFVQTGKVPHDDAPDSAAGVASMMRTVSSVRPITLTNRPMYL